MVCRRATAIFMVLALTLGLVANGCSSDDKPNVQLVSIQVNPDAAKIVVGETKQYAAVGTFDDLSTRDISTEVVWNSSNPSVATISETGLATGVTEGGTTIITAAAGNLVSNQASLEVVSESNRLISIQLEPTTAQIQLGAPKIFAAIGTYQDSSVRTITEEVLWESTNPTIVAISNTPGSKGVAVGLAAGNSEITASAYDIVSDPATATVTEVALETISISPANPTLPLGTTQEFKATGTYSDNTTADLTKVITWMSSNKAIADFSQDPGREGFCTALAEGSTSITAIHGNIISDPVTLTVTSASLVEITIEPSAPNVSVGTEIQFTATGIYHDGGTFDLTNNVAWYSGDELVVAFESATAGLALAKAEGSTEITASFQNVTSPAVPVTVNTPVNQQPIADIKGDATATVGVGADFSGSNSTDPDGTITNYTFNFGDGTGDHDNGTNPDITHTFTSANTFTVVLTVTDDLGATDADTMQVAVTTEPNQPPNAVMICPSSGQIGQSLQFDASNSTDPDGTITNYTFNFGDGTGDHDNGPNPLIFQSFTTESTFQVRLIVTDDKGAQDLYDCQVPIGATTIPEVVIIRPQGHIDVTQDQQLSVLVDANGQGGFSVTKVEILADGVKVDEDTTAPYEFDYTVPTTAVTGTTITLLAKAYDNNTPPGVGQSQPVFLDVRNYPPVADFTATISDALQITLDATSCTDTETPTADLEVRWDLETDGTFDTAWSTTKVLTHTYAVDGTYTITMEVRDSVLQTDSASRTVDLASQQTVGGTLTQSTTWYGTIIVTGSVTVPDGVVLDINPNTQILVMYLDQDTNGYGDFGIYVEGSGEIHVNGTDESPVLFTMYGSDHKEPGAWQGIKVGGSGSSSFDYTVIEYAKIGLEVQNAGTINNCTFRFNKDIGLYPNNADGSTLNGILAHDNEGEGIVLYNSDNVDMDNITSQDNGANGIRFTGCAGGGTMNVCAVTRNGADGIQLINSDIAIADCIVTYNHGYGVLYSGSSDGSMTHSEIMYNDDVGIRAESSSQNSHPHPTINYNNIYGNSVVAGTATYLADTSTILDVGGHSTTGYWSSPVWTAPNNGILRRVHTDYDEDYNAYGFLQEPDGDQSNYIRRYGSDADEWVWVAARDINGVIVSLRNYSSSYPGNRMRATEVEYTTHIATGLEMSVAVAGGSVNARYNYWGVFPNILDHITYTKPSSVDIQGFVGVVFDQNWNTGPYKAGDLDTGTWSGTIFVTGDINIASDKALTVDAGTNVFFVPIDQDYDGVGDYGIYVSGTLDVNGTAASRVTFTAHGTSPTTSSFDRVKVAGTGNSVVSYTDFRYGHVGMELGDSSSVEYCTFENNNQYGLRLYNADNASIRHTTVQNNLDSGVTVQNTDGLYATHLTVKSNAGIGVDAQSSAGNCMLEDSTIRENGGSGLVLTNSSWDINYCAILYNGGYGIHYRGSSSGTLSNSNVKYNDLPGLFLSSTSSNNPQPSVSNCNIYGNSVDHSVQAFIEDTSAILNVGGYDTTGYWSSNVWSIPGPGAGVIVRVHTDYDEDYNAYGFLQEPDGDQSNYIGRYSSDADEWAWVNSRQLTGVKVSLRNYSSSYPGNRMRAIEVEYQMDVDSATIELTALTAGGQALANHNYWGQIEAPYQPGNPSLNRISMSRSNAVDFTSWELSEVTPCGPR